MNRIVFSERIQLNWPVGRGLRDSSMPSTRNLFAPLASHFVESAIVRIYSIVFTIQHLNYGLGLKPKYKSYMRRIIHIYEFFLF